MQHEIFGELEAEEEEERLHLNGRIAIGDSQPCDLHITGLAETPFEEILEKAAASHAIFAERIDDLRRKGVAQWVDDSVLEEVKFAVEDGIADVSGLDFDPTTMEGAVRNYRDLMIVNYFTDVDEVSIYFEDWTGLFGVDVTLQSDLAFSQVHFGGDG